MIEIIHERENENDKTVFFKFSVNEEEFEWHGDCPKDTDPKKYFEAMTDKITLLIYNRLYPENDHIRFLKKGMTEIEAMLAWIADGCRNKIIISYYKSGNPKYGYKVIEKQPWRSTHPPELKLTDKIDRASITSDLKSLLKDIIMR